MNESPESIKLQATLKGYYAWVIERLRKEEGSDSEIVLMILREWLEHRREHVEREYGIQRARWRQVT